MSDKDRLAGERYTQEWALVVSDDASFRALHRSRLVRFGFGRVEVVEMVEDQLVPALLRTRPLVTVVEVTPFRASGHVALLLAREALGDGPDAVIVAMARIHDEDLAADLHQAGADLVLDYPASEELFASAVARHARKAQLSRWCRCGRVLSPSSVGLWQT